MGSLQHKGYESLLLDTIRTRPDPPRVLVQSLTWDRKASEGDVDVVLSWSEGDILNTAAAIFVVLTGHLRLRWTLDGQTKTSSASTSGGGGG